MGPIEMPFSNVGASSQRVEPGSFRLETAILPPSKFTKGDIDAETVAQQWVSSFQQVLRSQDLGNLQALFTPESYWRDQLCLSWNFHTLKNVGEMVAFFQRHPQGCRLKVVQIDKTSKFREPAVSSIDFTGEHQAINAFLTVETDVGRGRGLVRLCRDPANSTFKAYTLFTALYELKGHEETLGMRRPLGALHGDTENRRNWKDRRVMEGNFDGTEPSVVIIGAGQGGLTVAARLKMLGVPTLIIDRNARVGDNWRGRYHQLVLHDPVWYDHLPYMPFPAFWPKFTPKDKLGDWFESYASTLELNVWMKSTIKDVEWSDKSACWTLTVNRLLQDGQMETRTLHPRFIVQATGHSGEKNFPSTIDGILNFKGDLLCHSSEFPGAKANSKGKKAVVIGCCNSGHDIAQDYYENGYDVTIVQRSSTYVMSSKAGLDVLLGSLYAENGPPTEDADLVFVSTPNAVLKRIHLDATKEIARRDHNLLQGLSHAGFNLDQGPDGAGFFMKYFYRGAGYYIDVGCSQLIIDGKIAVKQGQEISRVNAHSLTLTDGQELQADEVVFATGYSNMRETCRRIFGDSVANRANDVWGLDSEGELRTVYRRSGHPGLWFMGGNLGLSRWYSRMLALQLKGLLEGIWVYDDL